jgi:deoxyribonuclease V
VLLHRCDGARLCDGDQQIGWSLRTRANAHPVFVSPGHRVSLKSALELTLRVLHMHRLPQPVHVAQKLSNERLGPRPRSRDRAVRGRLS